MIPLTLSTLLSLAPTQEATPPCYDWSVVLRPQEAQDASKDLHVYGFETLTRDFEGLQSALAYALEQAGGNPWDWRIMIAGSGPGDSCPNLVNPSRPSYDSPYIDDQICTRFAVWIKDPRDPNKEFVFDNIWAAADDYVELLLSIEEEIEDMLPDLVPQYDFVWNINQRPCWWG